MPDPPGTSTRELGYPHSIDYSTQLRLDPREPGVGRNLDQEYTMLSLDQAYWVVIWLTTLGAFCVFAFEDSEPRHES